MDGRVRALQEGVEPRLPEEGNHHGHMTVSLCCYLLSFVRVQFPRSHVSIHRFLFLHWELQVAIVFTCPGSLSGEGEGGRGEGGGGRLGEVTQLTTCIRA